MDILKGFVRFIPMFISLIPIILIIGSIILIIYLIMNKVRIKLRTFKGKGFRPVRGPYGVYCYCGKQGKGKTYSLVEYLQDNKDNITTFCNISGIKGIDYFHFVGFKEMLLLRDIIDYSYSNVKDLENFIISLKDDECKSYFDISRVKKISFLINEYKTKKTQLIFVFDEIFTELQRGSKLGQDIIDFLCQMRKREIICLTTCQEWRVLPLDYRLFCRFQIDCEMYPFLWTGFLIKTFKDAEHMHWDEKEQEHVAPLVETTITKCRKYIGDSYDTKLRISSHVYTTPPPGVQSTPQGEEREVNNENGISQQSENMPAFLFTSHK